MGIFYNPPPPNFAAAQPLTPGRLNPSIEAVEVDNPPSTLGGPRVAAAIAAAIAQPDWGYSPWPYLFAGNVQPYMARVQTPGSGVPVNPPPSTLGGPVALLAESAAIAQPDPYAYTSWPYTFAGARQPYEPGKLSPGIPGQDVDQPPWSDGGPIVLPTTLVQINWPEWSVVAWPYSFAGARQPYEPKKLSPGIPGQSIDLPPLSDGGPFTLLLASVAIAQPDPWTYNFTGGRQPFEPRKLSPGIPGQDVDLPPPTQGSPMLLQLELTAIAQPDPWVYFFRGAGQPYDYKKNAPGIPGQDVDAPPSTLSRPVLTQLELAAIAQPDWGYSPWPYAYLGARQPYEPKKNAPGIPGQSVAPPPSTVGGPVLLQLELAAIAQPDPWIYHYRGSGQPYDFKKNVPGIPGMDVSRPPVTFGGPYAIKLEGVIVNQPDWSVNAWPFVFMGARQPYEPRKIPPSIPRAQFIRTHNRGYVIW